MTEPPTSDTVNWPIRLGPNDKEPCGFRGARVRHWAKAERCDVCGTEGRTPGPQPVVNR